MDISKERIEKIKRYFIGNPSFFIFRKDHNFKWFKKEGNVDELLELHLQKQGQIGSYNIYKEDNIEYCKWIAIDIDFHNTPIVKRLRENKQTELLKKYLKSKRYMEEVKEEKRKNLNNLQLIFNLLTFFIPKESILLEESRRGYHFWIFLQDKTLLKDAFAMKKYLNSIFMEFMELNNFELDIEIFPKQPSLEKKKLGNAVKLPSPVILEDFCRHNYYQYQIDKKYLIQEKEAQSKFQPIQLDQTIYNSTSLRFKFNSPSNLFEVQRLSPRDNDNKLDVYTIILNRLRPCTRAIAIGRKQATGTNGHRMRIELANELIALGCPRPKMNLFFMNQGDYDPEITDAQLNWFLIHNPGETYNYFLSSCRKIDDLGYCLHEECELYNKVSRIIIKRSENENGI